ncbi:PAS domain S-box protein [Methylobacterium terricola]|uniref:Blue-light-activated histidine kinase n=1 Tax=Methylobacterium terricola TaxID=2583531 RepID=A0A5C4L7C5_9HYPH|nr:PAS domain S-box protein [Methylobacterium terricola]TNC05450.1 PAS domain S-box protein [Methylobacterium terricola]
MGQDFGITDAEAGKPGPRSPEAGTPGARGQARASSGEQERLRVLGRYQIRDTSRDEAFDGIALLAAEICGTPIAAVTLVGGDGRPVVKAEFGLGVRDVPLESPFCRQALLEQEVLEQDVLYLPDAAEDPRFAGDPRVAGAPGLRFYAGALLKTPEGLAIGTVCVLDTVPRALSARQKASLKHLARQAMTELELRRTLREQRAERELQDRILDGATDYAIVATDRHGRVTRWNEGATRILGWTGPEMLGRPVGMVFTPEDRAGREPEIEMNLALAHGRAPAERWYLRRSGERFWAQGETMPLTAEDGTAQGFLKILRDRSQRRAQEAARDADELRFRSLVEVSPQVVWFGDAAGTVTYCNAYWFDYTGLPPGDVSEASWMGAIHPDHREHVRAAWFAAARSGTRFEMEFPLCRADGEYRWFLSRSRPVEDGDGRIRSWIGIALDIHERKRAEGRFQVLTALSPATIWFGDPDGGLSYVNDRWYEYSGQTPEQALPLGWAEAVHPDDRPGLMTSWAEARARGSLYDTEARLRRRDGAYRWFSIRAEPLRDEAGTVLGWLGSNSDVHESRRTEENLRQTQSLLRLAAEATSLGIFDYNLATGALTWDAHVRAAFGLPPDAAVSYATFLAGLHPEDRARADEAVMAALDSAGPGRFDIEYRTIGIADGIERWVAAKGQAIVEQGCAVRFVGTVQDITARKRAEEHQRLLTGELQHRVKNTLALVQAIASQTLRGARDVDEMREAFASRLISLGRAHDILTQASWTAAPILDVVEGALSVHQPAGPARIRMSGPNVRLAAKPALSLALALHELATNAFKYGALSNETGLVEVRWHVVHGAGETRFSLTWSEHGGPPLLAPPQRKGFGSRLIERSFAAEVDGEVTLTYAPTGVVCRLVAALSSMQEQRSEAAA